MVFANAYAGKRVLVTGHTGFKGAWLANWLLALKAKVFGIALPPPSEPSLFNQLNLKERIQHQIVDVRQMDSLSIAIKAIQPEFIFHLAAQALVRQSYISPVETYETNIMGTIHVLESARQLNSPCQLIIVTTDKCYENREWIHSYREEDPMGGHDPYSSSKAATEIVTQGYRRSYFSKPESNIRVATARAGNVLGGGDWAIDRIMPDCIRSLVAGTTIAVRNKVATRPWQHVLEPLSGYLWLGALLSGAAKSNYPIAALASAFNFGPSLDSNRTVAELVETALRFWPGNWIDESDPSAVHEATLLNLATDKARHLLGWRSIWPFEETVKHTVEWYRNTLTSGVSEYDVTQEQIDAYTDSARNAGMVWAR